MKFRVNRQVVAINITALGILGAVILFVYSLSPEHDFRYATATALPCVLIALVGGLLSFLWGIKREAVRKALQEIVPLLIIPGLFSLLTQEWLAGVSFIIIALILYLSSRTLQ